MPRQREPAGPLGEGLRHFLVGGCWAGAASGDERWELFTLSSDVIRGRLAGLRQVWRDVGVFVKAEHPAPTFAETVLRLPDDADFFEVLSHSNRMRCPEHPVTPLTHEVKPHTVKEPNRGE